MGVVMGVMVVLMVVAFLGFGHHGGMKGSHGKESHKEEVTIKEPACTDCPTETGTAKGEDNLKREEAIDGQSSN